MLTLPPLHDAQQVVFQDYGQVLVHQALMVRQQLEADVEQPECIWIQVGNCMILNTTLLLVSRI